MRCFVLSRAIVLFGGGLPAKLEFCGTWEGEAAQWRATGAGVCSASAALRATLRTLVFRVKVKISVIAVNNGQVCLVSSVCESPDRE